MLEITKTAHDLEYHESGNTIKFTTTKNLYSNLTYALTFLFPSKVYNW